MSSESHRSNCELLLPIAKSLSIGDPQAIEETIRAAIDEGVATIQIEEVILQAHLFVGYPRTLQGMEILSHYRAETQPYIEPEGFHSWRRRGERICRRVYGRAYNLLMGKVGKLHPDLREWMVTDGYGKVLGRPALDLACRELCTVVMLLQLRNVEPQLHSHIRGALLVGVAPKDLAAAVQKYGAGRQKEITLRVMSKYRKTNGGG